MITHLFIGVPLPKEKPRDREEDRQRPELGIVSIYEIPEIDPERHRHEEAYIGGRVLEELKKGKAPQHKPNLPEPTFWN